MKIFYEIFMLLLALFISIIAIMDLGGNIDISNSVVLKTIDWIALFIFVIDYFYFLYKAKNRKVYIKTHIPEFIAIIPFAMFKIARLARLARLFRLLRFVKVAAIIMRFYNKSKKFLKTNGFQYVLLTTIIAIIIGSVGIYYAELEITINSWVDAFWWSFVTCTTVGYGDISPVTLGGRIIAVILMFIGIGFISMLTGTIATYFLNKEKGSNHLIKHNIEKLDLSDIEYEEVLKYVDYLKSLR